MPTPTCPVGGDTNFIPEGVNWRCVSCRILWATEDLIDPRFTFLQGEYQNAWLNTGRIDSFADGGLT